ncbi:glutamate--cysteine ligase [Streptomyces ramulosus]|uniref:carboxylate-amine ligase n=1 Tax=Streptomyces TaxID=1883 RepID=UPI0031EF5EE5
MCDLRPVEESGADESLPAAPPVRARPGTLTMGVEEEFLLVDPETRLLAPRAAPVIAGAASTLGGRVGSEITLYQVETRTDVHTRLSGLAEQLHETRACLAGAARDHGARLTSSGTPVLSPAGPIPIAAGARYARSVATFQALSEEQVCCACHIHLGFDDRALALEVSNHLRVWLPTLIAAAANSPFWAGSDTGYASWRIMAFHRWPVSGPPPRFASPGHYDELVAAFVATGSTLDEAGVYWDIRPSHHLPTLEIRVADACPTVDHTLLITALVRAAALTALDAVHDRRPAPDPDPGLLRAACWRAARDGLTGSAVDPLRRRLLPAREQLSALVRQVRPALSRLGDLPHVETLLDNLLRDGTGAERQRRAHRRRGRLTDTVDDLVATTLTPPHRPRGRTAR